MRFIFLTTFSALFSFTSFSQSRLHPFVGVHLSMNADAAYTGLSGMAGIDYSLSRQWTAGVYGQYFKDRFKLNVPDLYREGKLTMKTAATLVQKRFSKKDNTGFFLGAGLAYQRRVEDYRESNMVGTFTDSIHQSHILPAIRLGYGFNLRQRILTVELNGTGPYAESTGSGNTRSDYMEILTQLSFGLRFIF